MEKYILLPFDDKYAVSNYGNIKNVKSGKILVQDLDAHGYRRITLSINGERRHYSVHRLVARMFIDNPNNKPYINHKDGNKQNNIVSNLEWVTAKENDNHARQTGLKVQNKPIKAINIETNEELIFESLAECGRFLNYNTGSIVRVLKKKRTYHKKHKFVYL